MKTSKFLLGLFALVIVGCSKSTSEKEPEKKIIGKEVAYTILLEKDSKIKSQQLVANYESISISESAGVFSPIQLPVVDFKDGSTQTFYKKTSACDGEILSYDFKEDNEIIIDAFPDMSSCEISVFAVANGGSFFYLAYEITTATEGKKYIVRKIDSSAAEFSFVEIELTQKPIEMIVSNNRLFVLVLDAEITGENNLVVLDVDTFAEVKRQGLGNSVKRIFKRQDGNIVISYSELHSIFNVSTFTVEHLRYEAATDPKFYSSAKYNLDTSGNFYFSRPIESSSILSIPSVYNMTSNLTTLYFYDNFLKTEEIENEYQIAETTVVGFDTRNGLMLIGYKKIGSDELGGVLRVKPVPDPAFIDNINLDGIPYDIFIK